VQEQQADAGKFHFSVPASCSNIIRV